MKNRLTAVLSVTGVLVAGSSAALVNTQVLRHTGQSAMGGDTSGAQGGGTVNTVVLDATAPATTTAGAGDPTVPAGVSAANAPTVTATAYRVGESGTVVLDAVGGVLTIVSVTPNTGWLLAATLQSNPAHARVVFETTTTQVVFDANLLYGVVGTSVTVNALGGTSGGASGGGSP
ncbi:MAG: hypothetical protein ACO3C1_09110, partial [Ilumatobacteraceae bacterium]